MIIPTKVIDALTHFCDKVFDSETLDSETENASHYINKVEKTIDELIDEADEISELLRKDLHSDELNNSLYKRLKA